MTLDEAREIIKNAKPIVLPKSGNTVSIHTKKIMTFENLFNNGNSRRKERKDGTGTETTET